jgi:GNAT superfamily N-acetyltransferase
MLSALTIRYFEFMSENTITVRNYHPNDYEAVKQLLRRTRIYDDQTDSPTWYQRRIVHSPDSIKVAWDDKHLIAVIVIIDDWGPTIARLAVDPRAQQRGLGTGLLETAEDYLRKKYHKQVHILVPQNDRDLHQYLKNRGYRANQNLVQFSKDL